MEIMKTEIIKIVGSPADESNKHALDRAGELIRSGELVAFPTETVYGLGANGLDAIASKKIYEAKGRPSDNPLILHVANREMIDTIASDVSPLAEKIIASFCPGPITLILPKKATVPDGITGGLMTVGVRMPDNDFCRALIKSAGVPIAAPSANISGRPSPTNAEAVYRDMEGKIPLILDAGPCKFGVESTIVALDENETITILRPGAVTREMLLEICENVRLDPAMSGTQCENIRPMAPGMKYRHYAPKAPLTLIEPQALEIDAIMKILRHEIKKSEAAHKKIGIIVSDEIAAMAKDERLVPREYVVSYGKRGDLKNIAARLYDSLRFFDDTDASQLLAEATTRKGLGLAIMNRLMKASGGNVIC